MPKTKYGISAASFSPSARSSGDLAQLREPDGTWIEHDRNRLRHEKESLLFERNQLLHERNELQRRLDGERANIYRLNERRVQELSPDGLSGGL